jgi:hypothetical protein
MAGGLFSMDKVGQSSDDGVRVGRGKVGVDSERAHGRALHRQNYFFELGAYDNGTHAFYGV